MRSLLKGICELDANRARPQPVTEKRICPSDGSAPREIVPIGEIAREKLRRELSQPDPCPSIDFDIPACLEAWRLEQIAVELAGIKGIRPNEGTMSRDPEVVLQSEVCVYSRRPGEP